LSGVSMCCVPTGVGVNGEAEPTDINAVFEVPLLSGGGPNLCGTRVYRVSVPFAQNPCGLGVPDPSSRQLTIEWMAKKGANGRLTAIVLTDFFLAIDTTDGFDITAGPISNSYSDCTSSHRGYGGTALVEFI
jgi:hypothetical protein